MKAEKTEDGKLMTTGEAVNLMRVPRGTFNGWVLKEVIRPVIRGGGRGRENLFKEKDVNILKYMWDLREGTKRELRDVNAYFGNRNENYQD